MKIKATEKARLPKCYLYDGKYYILTAKGGNPIDRKLPYVKVEYADALKKAGIGCRVVTIPNKYDPTKEYKVCEYYDLAVYEKEKLPVYTKLQGSEDQYVFTGEVSAKNAVTNGTIKKAVQLREKVRYICAKQDLGGKMGIVKRENIDKKEIDLTGEDGGRIKMLQAYSSTGEPTKLYGIFDMAQVENNRYIQVVAAEGKVRGIAAGKKGRNKEDWEYLLGGDRKIIFI